MQCISCQSEINPKWKHAIEKNVCPNCGAEIMEAHLKDLLTSLGDIMAKLQQYPEQTNDWLFSNYNYIKTDSPSLINFVPKEVLKQTVSSESTEDDSEGETTTMIIKNAQGEDEEIIVEKKQPKAITNGFFERAEVIKKPKPKSKLKKSDKGETDQEPKSALEKTEHFKAIAKQIREEVSRGVVSEDNLASMISMEEVDPDMQADSEDVAEFESALSFGDAGVSSAISNDDDESGMTDRVLRMNMQAAQKKSIKQQLINADPETLRELHNKVQNNSKKLGLGGFDRSS